MPSPLNLATFEARLVADDPQVVSFDVFDTVVTRSFARPADLFEAVGEQLQREGQISFSPSRYGRLRQVAENVARQLRADREPNLSEIIAELGRQCGWDETQRAAAFFAELDSERRTIVALAPVVAWVEAARGSGRTVVFLSDMYLPAEFLRGILESLRIARPGDLLLVSSEQRTSKRDGGLFQLLLTRLGVLPASILHVGDNSYSDSLMPDRAGLHTLLIEDTQLGAIEQTHLPFSPMLDRLPSRLAAAARLGRIQASPRATDQALNEIGAGLLGPILVAFVTWTFHRAREAGLTRLYFVSRDGQVLLETALALQRRHPEFAGIECRYLYGSRLAWHHASLERLTPRHLAWLLNPQPAINATLLAHRLGVARSVLIETLRATPAAAILEKTLWLAEDINLLHSVLPSAEQSLLGAAKAVGRVRLARRYFEQEGLFDGTPLGVVELGWSGSMVTSLYHALQAPAHLHAFYLGQTREDAELPATVQLQSFLIEPEGVQDAFGHNLWLPEMLEALTAADHATVLGYRIRESRVEPTLKLSAKPMWSEEALAALRGGSRAFADALDAESFAALTKALVDRQPARAIATYLLSVLCRFTANPSVTLARPFLACSFSEDPADEHRRPFARPLTLRAALSSHPFARNELWPQGSLVCSSGTAQALVSGGLPRAFRHLRRRLLSR